MTTAETLAAKVHMPLENAYGCEDCKSIHNCSTICPACASLAIFSIAPYFSERKQPAQPESGEL